MKILDEELFLDCVNYLICLPVSLSSWYCAKQVIVLSQAKSILGEMRVRCNAIKQELESNIQLYKDSVKHSRTVEKQIQVKTVNID